MPHIHCPNCNYTGPATGKPRGCLPWFGCLGLFLIAPIFWPLFIIAFIMPLFLIFGPQKPICPECTYEWVSIALEPETENDDQKMIDEALRKFK